MELVRMCDVCGGVDDHPRHIHGVSAEEAATPDDVATEALEKATKISPEAFSAVLKHVRDSTTQMRHLDCCRLAGCPDGSCDAIQKTGADGLKGSKLREHLTSGKVDRIGAELSKASYAKATKENQS